MNDVKFRPSNPTNAILILSLVLKVAYKTEVNLSSTILRPLDYDFLTTCGNDK